MAARRHRATTAPPPRSRATQPHAPNEGGKEQGACLATSSSQCSAPSNGCAQPARTQTRLVHVHREMGSAQRSHCWPWPALARGIPVIAPAMHDAPRIPRPPRLKLELNSATPMQALCNPDALVALGLLGRRGNRSGKNARGIVGEGPGGGGLLSRKVRNRLRPETRNRGDALNKIMLMTLFESGNPKYVDTVSHDCGRGVMNLLCPTK